MPLTPLDGTPDPIAIDFTPNIEHVEAYTPGRAPYSDRTSITATQVVQHIADAVLDITDALVISGYTVPVPTSSLTAIGFLKAACAKCAAASIEKVAPTGDRDSRKATQEMCDSAMKMIAAGQIPGLALNDDESRPRSGYTATAFFQRDQQF